jgi:O-antigen ligase
MSRRNPRSPVHPGPKPATKGGAAAVATAPDPDVDPDEEFALWLGERLRRVALGATAALIVARALWPSEADYDVDAGTGLVWVLALLAVAGVALASALVGGTLRLRWSWTDAAVVALMVLVGVSAGHAADRRPAINLAWEWGALGFAYVLVRNLPRTRAESTALAGALAATAVAVSVFGLYQVGVELPQLQAEYRANPIAKLRMLNIEPGSPQQALLEDRLLGSNEVYSTFALANSLAGFLVGPLVVMLGVVWDNLTRRDGCGSRWGALALAALPALAVLVCLTLTKSRSAYIGLLVGLLVLAWRERRRVRTRTLVLAAVAGLAVVAGLVAAGLATGRLDRLVLTESGKSLQYRWEYWVGAWRVINETPRSFWLGRGPGNFAAPYVRYKLPEASEDIKDPHNFILEVWSTAGLWAVLALAAAVAQALWNTLGPSRSRPGDSTDPPPSDDDGEFGGVRPKTYDPSAPTATARWLLVSAGLGLVVAMPPIGGLNPFEGELFRRWLILGAAWVLAAASGLLLWRRRPLDASLLGAGVLAVLVNLLAAGGISVPAVALMLWAFVALGLNLRDERPCSKLRDADGRLAAFALAVVWVALLGTFVGAVSPYWKVQAALAAADDAMARRPPDYELADAAMERATAADRYSARPWQAWAALEYRAWMSRDAKPGDLRWRKVPFLMAEAVKSPRPQNVWSRHRDRAVMTTLLIRQLGDKVSPKELLRLRADVTQASRTAALLYPTNASLRARLAEASADIGMVPDAVKEGREALRLDELTPHPDKKLRPDVRQWLQSKLPAWEKAAAGK